MSETGEQSSASRVKSKLVENQIFVQLFLILCACFDTELVNISSSDGSDGRVVWSVCLLSCRLGFDSESGQTNDFKIGIHSFPA